MPEQYVIPKAPKDDFSILVISDSRWWLHIDEVRPQIQIRVTVDELAESIINDYRTSCYKYSPGVGPGLFYVDGRIRDKKVAKIEFAELFSKAKTEQTAWFEALIKDADDNWQRYRRHTAIMDIQRFACEYLGLEREWSFTGKVDQSTFKNCPACMTTVPIAAVICSSCKCILDPDRIKQFAFASA